jgi:outer membrane protein assembly factor BamB
MVGKERAEELARRRLEELSQFEPQLNSQTIPLITIYVTTDRGVVQAIDAQTGKTRWVTAAGPPSPAVEAPGINDRYVAVVNGSGIYVLNASDGKLVWQRNVSGVPGAGPALSNQQVFVPLLNGTVTSFGLEDQTQTPWFFRSTGRTVVQPTYSGTTMAWPTDLGHVYVAAADTRKMLYQVATNNAIAAPVAPLRPGRLLSASINGYIYCIEESSGNLLWRFSTGDRVSTAPVVVGEAVYVVTDGGNLFRISGKTGRDDEWPQWVPGIAKLLAVGESKCYCVTTTGLLVAINAETGARVGAANVNLPDLQVSNRETDRIVLASRGGTIQCLHEFGRKWPTIHVDLAEVEQEAVPEEQTAPAAEAVRSPDQPSTGVNPFAPRTDPSPPASGDADPFAPSSAASPFGEPSAPAPPANPFANPFE